MDISRSISASRSLAPGCWPSTRSALKVLLYMDTLGGAGGRAGGEMHVHVSCRHAWLAATHLMSSSKVVRTLPSADTLPFVLALSGCVVRTCVATRRPVAAGPAGFVGVNQARPLRTTYFHSFLA
jgi:hypothetical protein